MDQASEALIRRQDTHIDSLLERLKESRVIKVMDAVFSGTISQAPPGSDDRRYCLDLGLVSLDQDGNLRPTNAIYKNVAKSKGVHREVESEGSWRQTLGPANRNRI
jgi:hypothetical protein